MIHELTEENEHYRKELAERHRQEWYFEGQIAANFTKLTTLEDKINSLEI